MQALFDITPDIMHLSDLCEKNNAIERDLYIQHNVKRGLRDMDGRGVLVDSRIFPMSVHRRK